MTRALPSLALLLAFGVGCTGKDEEDTAPPLDTEPHEDTATCLGGLAPVIEELWLENTGLDTYEGIEYPTLTVWASASDEDWDLNAYRMKIWYDADINGAVDNSQDTTLVQEGTVVPDECGAPTAQVGLRIYLGGGALDYDSLYEWGATVTDANGYESELAITTGYTPTSTGEDGGP